MGKMIHYEILTNNPQVRAQYPRAAVFVAGDVSQVFCRARDRVHGGAVLISHPLSGSVKPNESPYKSVLVSVEEGLLDMDSLALIEGAVETLRKLGQKHRPYTPAMLDDFQVIDLDLVQSALAALPSGYHN